MPVVDAGTCCALTLPHPAAEEPREPCITTITQGVMHGFADRTHGFNRALSSPSPLKRAATTGCAPARWWTLRN